MIKLRRIVFLLETSDLFFLSNHMYAIGTKGKHASGKGAKRGKTCKPQAVLSG